MLATLYLCSCVILVVLFLSELVVLYVHVCGASVRVCVYSCTIIHSLYLYYSSMSNLIDNSS